MKKLYYILFALMISMFSINNIKASDSMVLCEYNIERYVDTGQAGAVSETNNLVIQYSHGGYQMIVNDKTVISDDSIRTLFSDDFVYNAPSGITNTEFECPENAYYDNTFFNEVCFSNNGKSGCESNFGSYFYGESTMVDNYRDEEFANLEGEINQNIQAEKQEIINAILNGESIDIEAAVNELLSIYDGYPPDLININQIQDDILSEIESALSEGESQIENNENLTEAQREELLNNYNEIHDGYNEASINITGTGARVAINDCKALLGSVDNPDDTAYWLKLALDLLKYLGIVALIVLTIVDFIGAVASQDNEAISKVTKKTVTRLVFAVLLFIVPTILQFIFDLAGITTTVDCGINSAES